MAHSSAPSYRIATFGMPPGAQITSTECTEMVIDSSSHYVCTGQWGPAAQ